MIKLKDLLFESDVMDKTIKYKDKEGNEKESTVGGILKKGDDHPAHKKAQQMVDKDKGKKSTKKTKISADPFSKDKEDTDSDVGGPSYANVPKGAKSSKEAIAMKGKKIEDTINKLKSADKIKSYVNKLDVEDWEKDMVSPDIKNLKKVEDEMKADPDYKYGHMIDYNRKDIIRRLKPLPPANPKSISDTFDRAREQQFKLQAHEYKVSSMADKAKEEYEKIDAKYDDYEHPKVKAAADKYHQTKDAYDWLAGMGQNADNMDDGAYDDDEIKDSRLKSWEDGLIDLNRSEDDRRQGLSDKPIAKKIILDIAKKEKIEIPKGKVSREDIDNATEEYEKSKEYYDDNPENEEYKKDFENAAKELKRLKKSFGKEVKKESVKENGIPLLKDLLSEGKFKMKGKYLYMPAGEMSSIPTHSDRDAIVVNIKYNKFKIYMDGSKPYAYGSRYDKTFKNTTELVNWLNKEKAKYIGIDDK